MPTEFVGDYGRLTQVLANLVSNAVKFTATGDVFVRVRLDRTTAERAVLRFEISDTGIGLTPQQVSRLFQPFSQADSSTTRKFGGTGLGLAISKQIVAAMDGDIGVRSEPGAGSTFWFTVSLGLDSKAQVPASAQTHPGRIVVAAENPRRRMRLAAFAAEISAVVEEASTSSAAAAAMRASASPKSVLVVDESLRDEVAALLFNKAAHLVAVVGATHVDDAISAGGITPLPRPLTSMRLRAAVLGEPPERQTATAAPTLTATESLSGVHVLLAEDNEMNQQVAIGMLSGLSITADIARNGRQAVYMVQSSPNRYAAVLMDIQMPELDGISATKILREAFDPGRLPIIAMTAHAFREEREQCARAGMNDYLTKPVTAERLATALRQHVVARPSSAPPSDLPQSIPGVAVHDAIDEFGYTPEVMRDLLASFHRQYSKVPAELRAGLAARDFNGVMRVAHTVRGGAAYLRARETERTAMILETELRRVPEGTPATPAMAQHLIDALDVALGSTATFAKAPSA